MSSCEQQQFRKKLEEDPYYIPSVPMYCVLGQDMDDTLGDLFFDQHPSNFQPTPPRDFYTNNNKENHCSEMPAAVPRERVKRASSVTRVASSEEAQNAKIQQYPNHSRRSRSLIKPGRPSVAKKADPPTEVVDNNSKAEPTSAGQKPHTAALAAAASKPRVTANKPNVFATSRKPMSPPCSAACPSPMKLRSNAKKDFNSSSLREPVQNNVHPATNSHQDNDNAAPAADDNNKLTIGEMMPRRRSRSLIKPGRPSVANRMPSTASGKKEDSAPCAMPVAQKSAAEQRRSVGGKPVVLASMTPRTSIGMKTTNGDNNPFLNGKPINNMMGGVSKPPIRDMFSTRKPLPLPVQLAVHSPMRNRLRSNTKTDSSNANLNVSSVGVSSYSAEAVPSTPNRRVSNYMAPTLSSTRRLMNTGNEPAKENTRRSRLPGQK